MAAGKRRPRWPNNATCDRNFGSQFALWDWMFGALYVPEMRETVELGIGRRDPERMQSIASLYLVPIKDAIALLRNRRRKDDTVG